jgi:hypothetical protein
MTKAFEIPSTPCKLAHINNRVEKHGDAEVPAVDIKFTGIVFTKDMLIEFTGDKHAWNLMFETKKGAAVEPTQQYFDRVRYFDGKFEGCNASIRFGMQTAENELEDVKVSKISFEPLTGGNTAVSLLVQYELDDTSICADLAEYQTREVHLGLVFGSKVDSAAKKQGNLPLGEQGQDKPVNKFGEGEAPPATH